MNSIISVDRAKLLPSEWDHLAGDNIFLKKDLLIKLEELNPCHQKYYVLCSPEPDSIVLTYRLNLNIFTYGFAAWKMPVTIIGVPCSVSKKGYHLGEKTKEQVFPFLNTLKGPIIILNGDAMTPSNGFAMGNTLPTCRLDIRWKTMDAYLLSMRCHYRYRLHKAMKKWQGVQRVELSDQKLFDEAMYELYLQVYDRSHYKLEKLSIDFFREFPSRIIRYEVAGKLLAFIQLMENKEELIFLFGGFDYGLNFQYDIYLNILLEIVKRGIEGGYKTIDMGQTAEDTKMKLGCTRISKTMAFHHSNKMLNYIIGKCANFLSYHEKDLKFNVFKETNDENPSGTA